LLTQTSIAPSSSSTAAAALDLLGIRDVDRDRQAATARGHGLCLRGRQAVSPAGQEANGGPFPCERASRGTPDTRGGARNHDNGHGKGVSILGRQ
jgi:hypothetical protein